MYFLVEEREEEMVSFTSSKKPINTNRKAWFLKPTSPSTLDPSLSSSSPPLRRKTISGDDPVVLKSIFRWWAQPQQQWLQWVKRLKPKYEALWKKSGIFDAIMVSTYKFCRDPSSLFGVISFWCKETNTFLFPWAEATLTLEDVMVLGGFSVLGEPIRLDSPLEGEIGEIESKMLVEYQIMKLRNRGKVEHAVWTREYMKEGAHDALEHFAFLSLWLSRFVIPASNGKTIGQYVIPIAVRLSQGVKIALAPAILASLYQALRQLKDHLTGGPSSIAVWAPLYILQLWMWERFLSLSPELKSIEKCDEPRAARWHDMNRRLDFSFVMSVIESPAEFHWRPYKHSFDRDDGEWISCNGAEDEELKSFALCLNACELVGLDCIEKYCPHRVAKQFGLDQDIPNYVPRADSWEVAWKNYDEGSQNVNFYLPPRLFEPAVTLQYSIWWKNFEGKEMMEGKKRKGCLALVVRKSMINKKKKKVQHLNDIKVSDGAVVRHPKSQEDQASATSPDDAHLYVSSQCSETMNCISEDSREIGVLKRKLKEEFVSDKMDSECKGIMQDVENLAYEQLGMEELAARINVQVMEVSNVIMDKNSTRELEIKMLKEEIASIQAQILELESPTQMICKYEPSSIQAKVMKHC